MLIGHQRIVTYLENLIDNNLAIRNFLFLGPKGLGKNFLALNFARTLLCQKKSPKKIDNECDCSSCKMVKFEIHNDLIILKSREGKEISINDVREIKRLLLYKPISRRIILIDDAELLSSEASDSLLKILEEAPQKTLFIFISNKILPATIISRLEIIKFKPLTSKESLKTLELFFPNTSDDFKEMAVYFSAGLPSLLLTFINFPDLIKVYSKFADEFNTFLLKPMGERFNYLSKYLEEEKDKRLKIINQVDFLIELWLKFLSDFITFSLNNLATSPSLPKVIKIGFSKIKGHNLKIIDLIKLLLELKEINSRFNLNEKLLLEQIALIRSF